MIILSTKRNNASSKGIKVGKIGRGSVGLAVAGSMGGVLRGRGVRMVVAERASRRLTRDGMRSLGCEMGVVGRISPMLTIDVRRGDCRRRGIFNTRIFCCRASARKRGTTKVVRSTLRGMGPSGAGGVGTGGACCVLGGARMPAIVMRYNFLDGCGRTRGLIARSCRGSMTRTITRKVLSCVGRGR